MKITEVRIFPTESRDGKLKAFATMTFDDWFVVRNVKIIEGNSGLFVAMPSRKAMDACPKCRFKNVRGSRYCNQCGSQIKGTVPDDPEARGGDHMDIAHPITQECRVYVQERILTEYRKEEESQVPGEEAPALNADRDIDIMGKDLADKEEETLIRSPLRGAGSLEDANDIEL